MDLLWGWLDKGATPNTDTLRLEIAGSITGTDVCTYIGPVPANVVGFSQRLACHLEVALDDENDGAGLGRNIAAVVTKISLGKSSDTPNLYDNCDSSALNGKGAYAFIVF